MKNLQSLPPSPLDFSHVCHPCTTQQFLSISLKNCFFPGLLPCMPSLQYTSVPVYFSKKFVSYQDYSHVCHLCTTLQFLSISPKKLFHVSPKDHSHVCYLCTTQQFTSLIFSTPRPQFPKTLKTVKKFLKHNQMLQNQNFQKVTTPILHPK